MKGAFALVLSAVAIGACDSDDNETASTAPADSRGGEDAGVARFRSPDIGFTFEYPKGMEVEKTSAAGNAQASVLGQVSVAENGRFNSLKIRQTADREVGAESYLKVFQRDFEAEADGEVRAREARMGKLDTAIIEFDGTADRLDPPVEFNSTSYFFTGAGRTWQLECIAESEHRERVDEVCRAALESVEFRPPAKKRVRPRHTD